MIFEQEDLDKLAVALEKAPWKDCENDSFTEVRREFLSVAKDMMPSGKVYTRQDRSNLEPCSKCEGEGRSSNFAGSASKCVTCGGTGSVEAYEDDKWRARADRELAAIEAKISLEDGRLFVAQFRYKYDLV